jgi:acyl carrier protein
MTPLSRQQLTQDLKKFFENVDGYGTIKGDTDLFQEMGLDSIRLMAFIAYIEQLRKQKIDITTLEDDHLRTIDNIIQHYF